LKYWVRGIINSNARKCEIRGRNLQASFVFFGLGRVSNFRNGNLFVFGARDFEVMRNIYVPFNVGAIKVKFIISLSEYSVYVNSVIYSSLRDVSVNILLLSYDVFINVVPLTCLSGQFILH
jgi:hypothetical protein